jgi:hypothetical protein
VRHGYGTERLEGDAAGDGPVVVFDPERRPIPEIPFPNDVATFADPTSRTGRRVNVSLVAPTRIERAAREGFDDMEGWGTYAPIAVRFSRGALQDPAEPALDLEGVRARMQADGHEPSNDPVYVVNLATGVPAMLDLGGGDFPLTLSERDRYYPNDPHAEANNPRVRDARRGQRGVPAALDLDFDGVLDRANTLPTRLGIRGVDDVIGWYEKETDTLLLRPLLPLEEMTEYAVVLTDRLTNRDGDPVRSPFPYVHHPEQRDGVARLSRILSDSSRKNYYGDLAGTGLAHVAFAWTFTTQPVYDDLRLLRDGLHGKGPFARLASEFPPRARAYRAVGRARDPADEPPGIEGESEVRAALADAVHRPPLRLEGADPPLARELPPDLEGRSSEPRGVARRRRLLRHRVVRDAVPPRRSRSRATRRTLPARLPDGRRPGVDRPRPVLVVGSEGAPERPAAARAALPVVVWGHGTTHDASEMLARAGYFARQGLATFAVDMPGHGLATNRGIETLLEGLLRQSCLVPWTNGVIAGRARDLNGDGKRDSGGLLWTSHVFHTRDNIRQSVVDEMQATRILKAFGSGGDQDVNGDGRPDLLGDFDGDGVADVGGTRADHDRGQLVRRHRLDDSRRGRSQRGRVGAHLGRGGVIDVATRSYGIVDSAIEQVMTPLVVALPASERPPAGDHANTRCVDGQRSLRMVVNDLTSSREIELACLDDAELGPA